MANSGISIGVPNALTTLSSLQHSFAEARQDQHLRFSDAKGLHTHGSLEFSSVDFLAKFRNAGALQERADLRQGAIAHVKTAIDNEFGRGIAERVFARVGEDGIGQGSLLVSDLRHLKEVAQDIKASDMATANARLGGDNALGALLTSTTATLGYDLSSLSQEQFAGLKERMAAAVTGLPEGSTPAQCARAAQGVLVADQLERSVADLEANATKRGLTDSQKASLDALIKKCFNPPTELAANPPLKDYTAHRENLYLSKAPVEALSRTLLSLSRTVVMDGDRRVVRPQVPDAFNVIADLHKQAGSDISKQEVAAEIKDLVGFAAADALKATGSASVFMRDNELRLAYQFVNVGLAPQFEARLPAAMDALMAREDGASQAVEHRAGPLAGLGISAEAQQERAAAAFQAYDRALTVLFGGADEAAMRAAAQQIPQDICDYIAVAHKAIETECDQQPDAVRQALTDKADINFVALRCIGPMIVNAGTKPTEAGGEMPDKKVTQSMTNFGQFLMQSANGTNMKDKIPAGMALGEEAQAISTKWKDNIGFLVDEITKRGNATV